MQRICSIPSCLRPTKGYSTHCTNHRNNHVRHGHPEQASVRVSVLAPYQKKVATRRVTNPTSDAWVILQKRWALLVDHAQQCVQSFASGEANSRHAVQAASQMVILNDTASSTLIMETALAMYLLQDAEPRRFRSDKAFDYQLVRRVRLLGPTSSGSWWNQRSGKTKRVYKDLPPRTVEALAAHLKQAFGLAGIQLSGVERRTVDPVTAEKERLTAAMEALQ